jgi:hypothetical protein
VRTLGSAAEIQWLGDDWGLVLYQAWSRMLTAGDTYHPFLYVKAAGIARKFPLPELKSASSRWHEVCRCLFKRDQ